ncbi:MAG: SMR family transporter [Pseudomonadota bacterium]
MNPTALTYGALATAIVFETIGTTLLFKSEQFTKLLPTLGMVVCYVVAFFFLSLTLKTIPVGVAYAMWSAFGIVLISLFGLLFLKQALDAPAMIGIGFIITGVVVINLFSKSSAH